MSECQASTPPLVGVPRLQTNEFNGSSSVLVRVGRHGEKREPSVGLCGLRPHAQVGAARGIFQQPCCDGARTSFAGSRPSWTLWRKERAICRTMWLRPHARVGAARGFFSNFVAKAREPPSPVLVRVGRCGEKREPSVGLEPTTCRLQIMTQLVLPEPLRSLKIRLKCCCH